MSEPVWVRRETLELLHSESIAEFGGIDGVRDKTALERALAEPRNAYVGGCSDLARLAARYACALASERPFIDGNEPIAFIAVGLFLRLNGWHLTADRVQAALTAISIVENLKTEDELVSWLRTTRPQMDLMKAVARKRRTALRDLAR